MQRRQSRFWGEHNGRAGRWLGAALVAVAGLCAEVGRAQPGPNEIQFSSATYTVAENTPGFITIDVLYGGGATNDVTITYSYGGGTAVPGVDYPAPVTNSLTFTVGQTNRTFTIPILDDGLTDGAKTLALSLSNPTGGAALGSISAATLTITDNETPALPPPANDNFTNATAIAGVSGSVTVNNNNATKETGEPVHNGNPGGASVWYRWTAPVSGMVTFQTTGASFANVIAVYTGTAVGSLTPVAAAGAGGTAVSLTFSVTAGVVYRVAVDGFNPGGGASQGTGTLNWSTAGSAGTVGFTANFFECNENESTGPSSASVFNKHLFGARITVTRSGGASGRVLIYYTVSNGTGTNGAVNGVDYFLTDSLTQTNFAGGFRGILVMDHLQTSASFLVGINDNGMPVIPPGPNAFITANLAINAVVLDPAESPAILPPTIGNGTATLRIYDDDAGANWEVIRHRCDEYVGSVVLQIVRGGGVADGQELTVEINGPAPAFTPPANNVFRLDAGSDYATPNADFGPFTQSGSFTFVFSWAAGQTVQNVTIPIVNDGLVEFNEDLVITIRGTSANPSPVGGSRIAYLTILAEDRVNAEHAAGSVDPSHNRDYFNGSTPPFNATPGANNTVNAVAVQPDGRTLLGGDFTSVNSVGRNRIARLNTDGSLDTAFTPGTGANGSVNALQLQPDNRILIAGGFSSFNSVARGGIARLNTNGTLDAGFNPGAGANLPVRALALYTNGVNAGKIIAAGDFTTFAGQNVGRLVRLNANGSVDTTFNTGTGANGSINAVVIEPGGRVIIGGEFTSVNGVARNRIARLTADGAVDPQFDPAAGADGAVFALGLDFGTVVTNISASLNRQAQGGAAEDIFDLNFGSGLPAGATFSGTLVIDYDFLTVPDTLHVYLGTNQTPGNQLFASGPVSGFASVPINFGPTTNTIIRIVINQGNNTNFGTVWSYSATLNASGTISALAIPKVVAAGEFNSFGLRSRSKIARLNTDGSVDATFEPAGGADDTIFALQVGGNGSVLVGGRLASYNGTRRLGVARLLADGTLDTGFMDAAYNQFAGLPTRRSPLVEPRPFVKSLAVQNDGNIIIGGSFQRVGGGGRNTPASGTASPWIDGNGNRITTPLWAQRDDFRNRFNIARLIGNSTPGPGNIGFAQESYSVDEFAGTSYITLLRTNGSLAPGAVTFRTGDRPAGPGAATAGVDYTALTATPTYDTTWSVTRMRSDANFGLNNLTTNINGGPDDIFVTILDDALTEGDEALNLVLDLPRPTLTLGGEVIPVGVALGRSSATLTIVDDDPPPTFIGFATNAFTVDEGAGTATITVTRTGNTLQSVSVDYFTSDGTAQDTQDYSAVFGQLTFAPGQTNRTFTIPIIDDTAAEPDETIRLTLTNLSAGASFRTNERLATLTIFDNDFAAGQVRFAATNFTANEAGGVAVIEVRRTGGNVGAIAVDYFSANGSAAAGADYTAVSGSLAWDNGDTSPRFFSVPVLTDGLVEGAEFFTVNLTNARVVASGVPVPVATPQAAVTITDADALGVLQFAVDNFSVSENGGQAIITVTRVGGVSETVSVNYRTVPGGGTATNGVDFLETSGTLTLGPGITSANFPVTILDNTVQNSGPPFNRTVLLELANFAPVPHPVAFAVLTIVDDERVNEPAGSVDTTYNASAGANNFIYTLGLQSDGRLVIGGDFTAFNGFTRNRIARLDTAGNLDAVFDPGVGASGSVRAMAIQPDGRIVISGLFTNYGGFSRRYFARLNVDGSLDQAFDPGAGADNPVFAVGLHRDSANAGKVVVGGAFSTINGVARPFVARVLADGTVDTGFATGTGPNGTVFAVAVQADGRVLIGGDFTAVNGTASPGLARLNANGTLDTAFSASLGAGADGTVRAIAIQSDGRIVVGGSFTNFNGQPIRRLARLNANGTLDGAFAPNLSPGAGGNDSVLAVALQPDGKLILAGDFTIFSGVSRSRITRLNQDGTVDATINFGFGANNFTAAAAVQLTDGRIVVGGGFTSFDGVPRNYLARLYGGVIAGPGRVEFSSSSYVANEGATNAIVTLRRTGGTTGSVSVEFATADLTAAAGLDYQGLTNTAVFPNAETIVRFLVPLLDDTLVEGNETVALTLATNAGSGVTLGNQPTATLTIVDDDSFVQFSAATYSVNENDASRVAPITITRTGGTNGSFTIQVISSNLTATAGFDYTAITNTLTFAPGELSKVANIPIIDDALAEGDETVAVRLVNPSGSVSPGSPTFAILTIVDNDFFPGTLVFASQTGFFVDENGTNAVITVLRTNGASGNITVNFSTSDGTATGSVTAGAGIDYLTTNGVLTFINGETNKSFLVPILSDTLIESNETVLITLSNPTGGASLGGVNPVTLTIVNNNEFIFGSFRFTATNYNATEGDGVRTITVQRFGGTNGTQTVNFATFDETAAAGQDYLSTSGTLTFAPGEAFKTFDVTVLTDGLVESNETVRLVLSNAVGGASLGVPSSATLTIISTNTLPGSFAVLTNEFSVNENGGLATITVLRTNGLTGAVSVEVHISDGTATAGLDYTNAQPVRTLTWADGDDQPKTFTIPVINDQLVEATEMVLLALTNATGGAAISTPAAVLLILDDEIPAGSVDANFVGAGANNTVNSVFYRPDNGRIVLGGDFTVVDGQGRTNVARLNPDGTVDGFDAGPIVRAGATNSSIRAVAVYTNGPNLGKVLIGGLFTSVGGQSRTNLARLNPDGTLDTSFTALAGANGPVNAIAIQPNGAIVIGGGFTTLGGQPRFFVARVLDDGSVDSSFNPGTGPDNVVRAVALQPDGRVLIGGDFTFVNATASPRVARLNANGALDTAFAASLGLGPDGPVYAVALQSDGRVLLGGAFTNLNAQPAHRFARLQTNGVPDSLPGLGSGFDDSVFAIAVQPADDKPVVGGAFTSLNGIPLRRLARLNPDGSQDLSINFGSGPNNFVAAIALQSDGRIIIGGGFTEVDGIPYRYIARLNGGANLGSGVLTFQSANFDAEETSPAAVVVRRLGGISNTVTVAFATSDGTATAGVDYTNVAAVLTFAPGEAFKTVLVPLVNDAVVESDETIGLTLSNPTGGATLGGLLSATVTILDDDCFLSFASPAFSVSEASSNAVISVIRTGGRAGTVTVQFGTSDGTAVAGSDYLPAGGTLTFGPGVTNLTFNVPILQDLIVEGNESLTLQLTNATGAATLASPATATLTIFENLLAPGQFSFSAPTFTVVEGQGFASIAVLRSNGNSGLVSVNVATVAGTATAGLDFTNVNTVLVFADGEISRTFLVPIVNDTLAEPDETVNLVLGSPTGGASLGALSNAVLTIQDDDVPFNFEVAAYAVNETAGTLTVHVTRTGAAVGPATVDFATANGTALAGLDYVATNGTLTFAAGQTTNSFTVTLLDDTLIEEDETFSLALSNPTGAGTLGSQAVASVTILDNDCLISFESAAFTASETSGVAVINLIRSGGIHGVATVNFTTTDGTATAGLDYTNVSGTVTFAEGQTNASFVVGILNDSLVEPDETVNLSLSLPTGGAVLASPSNAVLTVISDDAPGALAFAQSSFSVLENVGAVSITVVRTNGSAGAVTVSFAATGLTATPGSDFLTTNGVLTLGDGVTSTNFTLVILNDSVGEPAETVLLTLANPTGGATLGTPAAAVLTVQDDDASVSFSTAQFTAAENGGTASLTVLRTGSTNGAVTVQFATAGGTATTGSDFTATSGQVQWADGDGTPKTISIPIINDTAVEGDETFLVTLFNAANATLLTPSTATVTILDDDDSETFLPAGALLVSESGPTNGVIDPGETVTLNLALRNVGTSNSANLVGTLQTGGGVTSPSSAQNYGALAAGGPAVARPFTFTASGTNQGVVTAVLALQDGAVNHGAVVFSFTLGSRTNKFVNSGLITINDRPGGDTNSAAATPYPSTITVSGVAGMVGKVTVVLSNLTHTFPDDMDILLVSPQGQKVMLMSDAGSTSANRNPISNVTLTFDDAAAATIPDTAQIVAGTFRPANHGGLPDNFPVPAPGAPYVTNLSAFNGINPNGVWSLYIVDDENLDAGSLAGWCLNLIESSPVNPPGDLAVTVTDSPDPVFVNQTITYTIIVTNGGGATANNVTLSNVLPAAASFVSAVASQGSVFKQGNDVTVHLGTIANNAGATVTIVATATAAGSLTNRVSVTSGLTEQTPANNAATAVTTAIEAADLAVGVTDSPDPVVVGRTLTYVVTVTNRGPGNATGVAVTNMLPATVSFVSASASQGSFAQSANMVTANLGAVANGAVATLTIVATPTALGTVTDSVTVRGAQTDPDPANNAASGKTTVIAQPGLQTVRSGGTVTVSWPAEASNFVLEFTTSLTPPVNWQLVPGTPVFDPVNDRFVVTFTIDPMAPAVFLRLRQ